jgi:ribonucleoside-diphosphate reductase alpha chain
VQFTPGTPGGPEDNYNRAIQRFVEAQEELDAAKLRLNKIGIWPSPPIQVRYHLPDERSGNTCKFEFMSPEESLEGYFTCNVFTDGRPGELFIVVDKEGSFVSGLLDTIATLISIALQCGVPPEALITKFRHTRFGPSGMTKNPQIRTATSVIDFIMHWLELRITKTTEGT